jgi:cytosine/adenosine deaminase-related metal-dependent hydrolase
MALMRGIADDALMAWLQRRIWPVEAKHVSDEFVRRQPRHGRDAAAA